MFASFGAGSKINRQRRSQLTQALRAENIASSSSPPDSEGHWKVACWRLSCEPRACTCSPHLFHLPLSRTILVILTLWCHALISVTLLHFCTLSSTFASFNILCVFPSLCFLATPTSGDAPFLATRMLGDACRLLRIFVFYLFTPWSCTSSGKKIKTEAKLFLNFSFFLFGWPR